MQKTIKKHSNLEYEIKDTQTTQVMRTLILS